MANDVMVEEYDDEAQRYAICNTQWREAQSGKTTGPDLAYKTYDAKLEEVGKDERAVIAIISTSTVDREGEVLVPAGAKLQTFRKNPIVLWAHKYDEPPIAKAAPPGWIRYDKALNAIKAKIIFAETELAENLFQLYRGGFLRAFSVGYDRYTATIEAPGEKDVEKQPDWAGARAIVKSWELLEFSACPIGMNPEALAVAVSKGLIPPTAAKVVGVTVPDEAAQPPQPPQPAIAPIRRSLLVPKARPVRRTSWPATAPLTTAESLAQYVQDELDRLRGRC